MVAPVRYSNRMTKLAGKTIMTINQFAVCDNAATYARSEGNHNEILHTLGCSVHHFPQCRCISVIGEYNRQVELRFNQFSKWYNAFPREIRSVFYHPRIIV